MEVRETSEYKRVSVFEKEDGSCCRGRCTLCRIVEAVVAVHASTLYTTVTSSSIRSSEDDDVVVDEAALRAADIDDSLGTFREFLLEQDSDGDNDMVDV